MYHLKGRLGSEFTSFMLISLPPLLNFFDIGTKTLIKVALALQEQNIYHELVVKMSFDYENMQDME